MLWVCIIIVALLSYVIGACIVWIRSDRSRLWVMIPWINFYIRTQIAWRSSSLSLVTSSLNIWLVLVLCYSWYDTVWWVEWSTILHISNYIQWLLLLLMSHTFIVVIRLLLQIWVNWGVAHRRWRWLLTGIELTLFPWIFWLMLWLLWHYHNSIEEWVYDE